MTLPPAPEFKKKHHHVVPQLWQKRFAAPGVVGPFYRDLIAGKNLKAQGPGNKMSEEYVNIVFDELFRPSDWLENKLSDIENKFVIGLDRLIATGLMDSDCQIDIAMMIAVQSCRYPDRFLDLFNLAKFMAASVHRFLTLPNVHALNLALDSTNMLSGARINESEFHRLKAANPENLAEELKNILDLHGYEAYFNPSLILAASLDIATHLLGLEWDLLHSATPAFILSDRPVPVPLGYEFSLGLSASYALKLRYPTSPALGNTIHARPASKNEIDEINNEVRKRAHALICGPDVAVHSM